MMADLERKLAAAFEQIHQQRMLGLPILHPGLRVAVVGGRDWQGEWLGILLTPWCMNLVLIPGPDSEHRPGPVGRKQRIDLPAGQFELIASEEAGIGPFAACSLFSPMHDFADQANALATAESIMLELFESQGVQHPARPSGNPSVESGSGISRRDLLRGRISGRGSG